MLQFAQDDTDAQIIVTLTEKVSITDPYFLFEFTHVTTKDVVKFIKAEGDDESDYPNRFNEFSINPSVVFANKLPGEWHYAVYEMTTNNVNGTKGAVLEYGKLMLNRATDFSFTKYNASTSFKAYDG